MTRHRTPLALLLVPLAAACGAAGAEQPPATQAVAVRMAAVADAQVAQPVAATGTLAGKEEIRLSFKIPGVVAQVLVNEGDAVRRGQPLASLDLAEIDAQVRRARQGADKAERDLARARALYADSVVPLAHLQDAQTGAAVARAELQVAGVNRRYAVITAPADGTVLRRFAEGGELMQPGAPVLVLGATGQGTVLRAGLADRDAVRIREGDRAVVRFDAFPGEAFPGRVTQIAAAAAAGTGTYEVEVAVDGRGRLASGMIGRVEIAPSRTQRLRLVPVEAVLEADGDSAAVFTVDADGRTARRRRVAVAFLQGDRVALRGGLDGVAEVVTDGAAYLEDGLAVRKVAP